MSWANIQESFDIIRAGGWVMIMLFLVGLILYISGFSAIWFLWRGNLSPKTEAKWAAWIDTPAGSEGRVGEIIRYVVHGERISPKIINLRFSEIRHVIITAIDRRLIFVKTLVAAAPLAGLLGTVIGMLNTFMGLANSRGGDTMSGVASGIQEALITTQTGLLVALPGVFISLMIRQRRNMVSAVLARLESMILLQRIEPVRALESFNQEPD